MIILLKTVFKKFFPGILVEYIKLLFIYRNDSYSQEGEDLISDLDEIINSSQTYKYLISYNYKIISKTKNTVIYKLAS